MKRLILILALLSLSMDSLLAQQVVNGNRYFVPGTGVGIQVPNSSTTLHTLAKLTGGNALTITTSDSSGIVGVVAAGAGTSGNAAIMVTGEAYLIFDGATTAGDYVQASTTVAGYGHDAGATCPGSGQVVGRVLFTYGFGGMYPILVGPQGCGGSGGGGGTIGSIGMTVPTGLSVSPPSLSSSGTFTLSWSGQIPSTSIPNPLNQNTSGYAGGLAGCPDPSAIAAGSLCYSNGSTWNVLAGNTTATAEILQEQNGVPSFVTPPGGTTVTVSGAPTAGQIAVWVNTTTIQGLTALPSGTTATTQSGGDSSTDVATDQFVANAIVPLGAVPASAQVAIGNAGGTAYAPKTLSQDATVTNAGVVTVGGLLTKSLPSLGSFSSAPYLTYTGSAWAATNPFASPSFTGTVTLPITGTTQCLQVNTSGVIAGTGAVCGTGGGGGNVNGPGSSAVGNITLFNNTSGTLLSDAGFAFPLANAHLANSTIGIAGTALQITSSTAVPALGAGTTIAIANPFTFPGKWTGAASTTSASTAKIPSGSAPTSPGSGDLWNLSGILQFYDGTHTNSLATIQSAPTSGHYAAFSGTSGLLADGGAPYALPTATSSTLGGVKPDGTSILNTAGVISATSASVGAELALGNPSTNGYILSSTTSGTRSWVSPATGTGTVTVVGAGSLTATAIVTGGGSQTAQTPNTLATMDSSGNIIMPGTFTSTSTTTPNELDFSVSNTTALSAASGITRFAADPANSGVAAYQDAGGSVVDLTTAFAGKATTAIGYNSGSISASVGSINIASSANFPTGQYVLNCDVIVTAVSGSPTLAVTVRWTDISGTARTKNCTTGVVSVSDNPVTQTITSNGSAAITVIQTLAVSTATWRTMVAISRLQ